MIGLVDSFFSRFSQDLGIDLGTVNTLIYVRGKGVAVREPSIVSQHKKTKKIVAIGEEAKRMLGRTPENIITVRPLKGGVISDFDTTQALLSTFVKKIHAIPGKPFASLSRPRMIIGIPSRITAVEKKAIVDAARSAGAREVVLIEEPMAAAIGAGLPVTKPVGSMIVDIGGGTCEMAVISLGGIVVGKSLKIGGDDLDLDIINYVRLRFSLAIGEKTAEEIKITLGSAYPLKTEKEMMIRGRDLEKGLPKTIKISSSHVREAISPSVNTIVAAIKDTVNDAPPELVSDVYERGITLSGGGAKIQGLAKLISSENKIPVTVADEPLSAVARGCAKFFDDEFLLAKVKVAHSGK